ncbi:MAG TPA: hypothetical protein DEP62_05435, partial [Flavobacteriales bacterium]|nr:hypothetical protein [Flavobacteriales bacterium]
MSSAYLETSFQDVVDDLHMWIDDLMTRTLFRAALGVAFLTPWGLQAQSDPTFPVNGTHDKALVSTVLEHATVHLDATTVLEDGTVVMHRGRIVAAGPASEVTVNGPAVRLDMMGLHLYPSFVDVHSDFGTPEVQSAGWSRTPQDLSDKKGAFGWNEAVRPETSAAMEFDPAADEAKALRKA